ncbi:MAG: hypothetical protein ACM3ZD_05530 [Betaproteobacteria bacterium]
MQFRLFKRPSTLALEASLAALAVGYLLIVAGLAVPFLSFVGVGVMLAGLGVVFDLGAGERHDTSPLWPAV